MALSDGAVLPDPEVVRKMNSLLAHRGPDDEGYLFEPGVQFGHRRLSIIDRRGGHQPIANEDGSRHIIFNGEIYNHAEVRRSLEQKGHRYRTASDTETLLHLMEEEGPAGLNRLNGMWAFAVHDRNRRRLLLARDRMGVKPLYYAQAGDLLLFASEIKALVASGLVPCEIDPAALAAYLECQYVPGPRTIFKAIKKLPPGHVLLADPSGIRLERFWRPAFRLDRVPSFRESAEQLRALLLDSVRLRLLSEVPLGAFLSGGIDSSIVVALMGLASSQKVKTFTVGFQGEGWYDESPEAEAVARHCGTDHQTLKMESVDLPAHLELAVRALDEPMADPASIPTYLISRFARQWVTVVLTGEGADEIFGGYDHFRFERILARLGLLGKLAGRAGSSLFPETGSARIRRGLEAAALSEPERHLRVRAALGPAEVSELLGRSIELSSRAARAALEEALEGYASHDPVNRLLFQDLSTWLHDDLLMKVDKMSMLASLEARVPFLDYRVVELLFSLPGSYKIRRGRGKALLRAAFADLIPPRTLERRKHGFALPIRDWLHRDLRDYVHDLFASRGDAFYDHVDRKAVEAMMDRFYHGRADRSLPLWILLTLKVWFRQVHASASLTPAAR